MSTAFFPMATVFLGRADCASGPPGFKEFFHMDYKTVLVVVIR